VVYREVCKRTRLASKSTLIFLEADRLSCSPITQFATHHTWRASIQLPILSLHMNYPPAALLPAHPGLQEAQCATCNYASAHPLVTSDAVSVPRSSACVSLPNEREQGYWFPFHRIPPRPTSTWPVHIFLRYILAIFYYATCSLDLRHVWFSIYQLIPNGRSSDLENAPTSRRSRWTKTVQKMKRVWTLIIMISSFLIMWVLMVIKCS